MPRPTLDNMTRLALLEIPQGTKAGTEHVLDNKNIASSDVVEVELGKGPEKVGLAETETQPEWHIAAPYTEPRHQLDLSTLDISNRLLALALSSLADATPAYATTPYEQAMNWPKVMTTLKLLASQSNPPLVFPKTDFYVVEFRSKLKPANEIDKEFLFRIDKESHREAAESGGLLKYWYGKPDQERHNLATCKFPCSDRLEHIS